jgi:adenylate cyclase
LLKKLIQPSSFKLGCLIAAAAALFFVFSSQTTADFLRGLDNRVTDLMFRLRGSTPVSPRVVVVDIDEKSLAELGQWPWPRSVFGQLLHRIDDAGAAVVGLDIVFAEPDRTSPQNFLELFAPYLKPLPANFTETLNNDVALGVAIGETATVLGYFFELSDAAGEGVDTTRAPFPEFSVPADEIGALQAKIPAANYGVLNLPEVAANCLTEGFVNAIPDASGIVRRVPLFIRYQGTLYPSLALEMAREALGQTPQLMLGEHGVRGVMLGERPVYTDEGGQIWINFRGPPHSYTYVSAVDVLKQRLPEDTLSDKIVLVGTSTWGLRDLRATPFSSTTPGVEIQANLVDNILKADPMHRDYATEAGIIFAIVLGGGVLLSLALCRSGPIAGVLIAALFVAYLLVINYYLLFMNQKLVGIIYPLLSFILVFVGVSTFNYFYEGREKRFIRHAFSHYVSPMVVNELLKHPERLRLEGEEKTLTVMFSDIRDFSPMAERLSPRQVQQTLNEHFTSAMEVIMDARGTVDKLLGDALMAMWGAPLEDPEHAANCIRAALAMGQEAIARRPYWEQLGLPPIVAGVGVNTGIMTVGNMGGSHYFDYTVIGDNVNLAARVEKLNKIYGTSVLVTEATRNVAGPDFFCRPIDTVLVKGRRQPVRLFEPLCEGKAPDDLLREVETFAEVLERYHSREFRKALAALEDLNNTCPCQLYQLYLQRVQTCLENPPPDDWDGVFKTDLG